PLDDGTLELRSERIFLKPALAAAALRVNPRARPITTYFVNNITGNDRLSPYAFVAAPGPPRVPVDMAPDRILINDWLAEDLDLTPGDAVRLNYYAVDTGSRLTLTGASFVVAGILPTAATAQADRTLAPDIPGISDVANCRDWHPGIPIDLNLIREKDQKYWDNYGPLPRAFVSLAAAENLWSNRFGAYTALRFPPDAGGPDIVTAQLLRELSAAAMGLTFSAAKAEGLAASRDAVEFGPLFTGLSFFLIAAAVLLTILLFAFNIQQRITATGTLRALGFTPGRTAQILLAEGLLLVTAGALLGGLLAPAYNALVLLALQTIWQDAVRTSAFQTYLRPVSLVIGMAGVVTAALVGMLLTIRGQTRKTIRDLQHKLEDYEEAGTARPWLIAGILSLVAAIGMLILAPAGRDREAAGIFFATGALLLAGLLVLCQAALLSLARQTSHTRISDRMLILRGPALRRGRSLACATLMALGVFLVIAVAANRRVPDDNPDDPAGGAGGYRLWCETTLPLLHDLNSARGRTRYGLSDIADNVHFTQLRLVQGDDASCLNLNRVARPHLLGVDPAEFARRGAFTFARLENEQADSPWKLLERDLGPDTIPGIADDADIVWGLGKRVGDTLNYLDENGQAFRIKLVAGLANSIFQGHLLVSTKHMAERFPAQGGSRVLLVETPAEEESRLRRLLTERLADMGLAAMTTRQRLAEFNSVENTYLAIFMLLGGLGLLLGSTGMGIVAARNILERRAAWALLRAVGFRRRHICAMIFAEHALLAGTGVGIGCLAAMTAMTPALLTPGTAIPWSAILATLAGLLLAALLWILLAVRLALRGNLTEALRDE
ncbi:MAG: hypothetical protein LC725_02275, partial [Lentisphaerae bacterium]|nr:hypothetical protein [Lentisphaerota bacterium]